MGEEFLPAQKFLSVHLASAGWKRFVRHYGVQHFVVDDVFNKPEGHERRVEQRMNTDDLVVFLNGPKNKVRDRFKFPASPP